MIDLVGHKYGKLTVISLAKCEKNMSGRNVYKWNCLCDCGNSVSVESRSLRSGNTKSCGCLVLEHTIQMGHANKKYNTYDLSTEYGIGYTPEGKQFLFDKDMYEKIKYYYWSDRHGYLMANKIGSRGKSVFLHRLILNLGSDCKEKQVDHINHNTYDNRVSNLRIVNNSQNQMNTSVRYNTTTGNKGVYFEEQTNSYRATITKDGQNYRSKRYKNMQEAIDWRREKEEELFGEFSYEKSIQRNT